MGSADWMNRNIYRRIEVCFPVTDTRIKDEIVSMVKLQWNDNVKAVMLNSKIENAPISNNEPRIQSQQAICELLNDKLLQI
jgi:polyphosphate kinase